MSTPTKQERTLKKGIALLEKQLSREDLSLEARISITKDVARLTSKLAAYYEQRKTPRQPVGRPSTNKKHQPLDPLHDPESSWYLAPGESIPNLCGEPVKAPEPPAPEQADPGSPEGTDTVGGILGTPKDVVQEFQPIQKVEPAQETAPSVPVAPGPPPSNAPTFLIDMGAPTDLWKANTVVTKPAEDQKLYMTNFSLAFAPGWMGEDGRRRLEEQAVHMPENSYEVRLLKLFRWVWEHYRDSYYKIKLPGQGAFTASKRTVDPRELRRNELLASTVPMPGEVYEPTAPRGPVSSSGFMPEYGQPATEPAVKKAEPFNPWSGDNPKPEEPEF